MFDAYRRPAWHAHYFEQESIKENLRILAAAHTDPYVLEQAYAQDEESEPMDDAERMLLADMILATSGDGESRVLIRTISGGVLMGKQRELFYKESEVLALSRRETDVINEVQTVIYPALTHHANPTGDPLDDDENTGRTCLNCGRPVALDATGCDGCHWEFDDLHTEPAEASDVTGWDQHGPSYE